MVEALNIKDTTKIRLIQLSDPHLGAEPNYSLSGVKTLDSLNMVLADILSRENPVDRFLVTGDIAAHGHVGEYRLFAQQMSRFNQPFNWLPGNHDEPQVMAQALGVPFRREVVVGNWLLLLLNSKQRGVIAGLLDREEIREAAAAADRHQGPVAVFLHHPPLDVGCAWLDKQKVENGAEFLTALTVCGNVKAVFSGHVHQQYSVDVGGISVNTSLSTCFQFAANNADFALSDGGPGYRWIDLYSNGHFETGVVQLKCAEHRVDLCSAGY